MMADMVGAGTAAESTAASASPAWITGTFTLAGALLGGMVLLWLERSRRNTTRLQWLLDRRHERYAVLIEASHAFEEALRVSKRKLAPRRIGELHVGRPGAEPSMLSEVQDAYSSAREALTRLRTAQERVRLVAQGPAGSAALELHVSADDLLRRFGGSADEFREATKEFQDKLDQFSTRARAELQRGS